VASVAIVYWVNLLLMLALVLLAAQLVEANLNGLS
jgi:hypothetical protein